MQTLGVSMATRILISVGVSIAFLLASLFAFGLLAANQAPRWLTVPAYLVFSWPMTFMSKIFPNTTCLDGHEVCGYSSSAYLATGIFLLVFYSAIAFIIFSWRSSHVSSKHPA